MTLVVPMIEPAPGWSSTTNDCLSSCDRYCAIWRQYTSAGPPAANGTMMRTGWVGYSCADADRVRLASAATAKASFDGSAMRILRMNCDTCAGHGRYGLLQAAVTKGQEFPGAKRPAATIHPWRANRRSRTARTAGGDRKVTRAACPCDS